MNQGGNHTASSGFTIVETMIVLAVTAALFISAVGLISGKQNKTQFTTAINGVKQQLEQIINESTSGYYPNGANFKCVASTTNTHVDLSAGSNQQGTNSSCVFMGKAIQFGLGSGDNASKIAVIPLVGRQYTFGVTKDTVSVVANASPRALYDTTASVDATQTVPLGAGLTVATSTAASAPCPSGLQMCYVDGSGTKQQTGMVAFLAGDSQGNIVATGGGGTTTNAQTMSLYGVKTSVVNETADAASQAIGNYSTWPDNISASHASKVNICLQSGTTNQSGLITIDSGLNITLIIYGDTTC